jgi:DNA-binding response OmpR family regulator
MIVPTEESVYYRPCLLIAHADSGYAARASRAFRRVGWDVYVARTGPEARRLARMLYPDLAILDADLPEESGWLTCEKLVSEQPLLRVILAGNADAPEYEDFAAFVGATGYVPRCRGVAGLVAEACGAAPAATT